MSQPQFITLPGAPNAAVPTQPLTAPIPTSGLWTTIPIPPPPATEPPTETEGRWMTITIPDPLATQKEANFSTTPPAGLGQWNAIVVSIPGAAEEPDVCENVAQECLDATIKRATWQARDGMVGDGWMIGCIILIIVTGFPLSVLIIAAFCGACN